MSKYIIAGHVNFCFNRPESRDIEYSVELDDESNTPPIHAAMKMIRHQNCFLCGKYAECDNEHKKLCRVTITSIEKVEEK